MTALLTLTDVSMHFSREADSRYAVFGGINLKVGAGECVALIGRNGSGKSTLLRVMAKIFAPTSGSVSWAPGVAVSLLTLGLGFRPSGFRRAAATRQSRSSKDKPTRVPISPQPRINTCMASRPYQTIAKIRAYHEAFF